MLGIGQSGKSWKTTIGGVVNVLVGSALIGFGLFTSGITPTVSAALVVAGLGDLSAGISLIFAKDKDVTGVPNAMYTKDLATTPPTSTPIIRDPVK